MATGISIHLGLNGVNSQAYNGWDGALSGCVNDAQSMRGSLSRRGSPQR